MRTRRKPRSSFLSVRLTVRQKRELEHARRIRGDESISDLVKASLARVTAAARRKPAKRAA